MAPPTVCIVALVLLQAGILEIIRPSIEVRLELPAWERVSDVINRFALPLFLFHTTGLALYMAINYVIFGNIPDRRTPGPDVVVDPPAGVHRAAAVHPAGDLPVRAPVGDSPAVVRADEGAVGELIETSNTGGAVSPQSSRWCSWLAGSRLAR